MSPDSAWSLAHIAAGFALSVALGFGAAYWLLPAALRRHVLLVAPGAGYALFSLATIAISVNFHLPANVAVWIALAVLGAASAAAGAAAWRRGELRGLWLSARPAALATLLMVAIIFWPVIYQGTSLYLGTANIDFYQSLAYQEVVARYNLGALDPRPAIDYSLDPFFGSFPDAVPAKFGGVMFGLVLQKLLFVEARTALMTALVTFLLALPAATCLFARTALAMEDREAALSAGLIAVSAPVAMSFLHVLVGQNSSLALLPLGLAACYLAIASRDWRAMLLAFLLLEAVFWMYVAMLPYIGAPVGLYALHDLWRNRRGAPRWLLTALAILAAGFVLLQLGMRHETRQLVDDMVALLGHANRTVYVDFLTEISLPHSLGLASYPITSSVWLARAPTSSWLALAGVFVAAAMLALAFYFRAFADWARRAQPGARAFALAMLGTYLAVWVYFNFVSLYGYAIFKMSSWLQFFFVPFVAYGLVRFAARRRDNGRRAWLDTAAVVVGGITVAANALATLEFGVKGLGNDTQRGAIVNSYGIGGNRDYVRLESGPSRVLPPRAVVGVAMPDYIANLWASYYVERGGLRVSLVSHDDFPDEDAVLPDLVTGMVVNSANQALVYKPRYHAERPPYLLLEGPGNLNREITERIPQAEPLWANDSFALVDIGRARDVLVTARGFYRLEYFDRTRFSWWWPDRMRWTAEGGEFLLLNASKPQLAHRLSLLLIAGTQRTLARHVEIWANGRKIDEIEVHGAARIVSKPFHPTGGFDKIVVRIRERVEVVPRNFGLWNRHIAIDQRHLNMVVTQARLLREGEPAAAVATGSLDTRAIIDGSVEFNGLSMDGWASPDTRIVLPLPPAATRARMRIEVPGWAGYAFPMRVATTANGVRCEHQLPREGTHDVECDFAAGAATLALRIESLQSTQVPGTGTASFLLRSMHVE